MAGTDLGQFDHREGKIIPALKTSLFSLDQQLRLTGAAVELSKPCRAAVIRQDNIQYNGTHSQKTARERKTVQE